jgi:hypothetical protein
MGNTEPKAQIAMYPRRAMREQRKGRDVFVDQVLSIKLWALRT